MEANRRRAAQVLEKNTYIESGQKLIKLGDKSVAWDDSFRLFFTTKLGNPHYSPEVMAKTMLNQLQRHSRRFSEPIVECGGGPRAPDLEEQFRSWWRTCRPML